MKGRLKNGTYGMRDMCAVHIIFAVAGWKIKKAESSEHENDNSPINQFNESLAPSVAPSKWLLDRQSSEIRTGLTSG